MEREGHGGGVRFKGMRRETVRVHDTDTIRKRPRDGRRPGGAGTSPPRHGTIHPRPFISLSACRHSTIRPSLFTLFSACSHSTIQTSPFNPLPPPSPRAATQSRKATQPMSTVYKAAPHRNRASATGTIIHYLRTSREISMAMPSTRTMAVTMDVLFSVCG